MVAYSFKKMFVPPIQVGLGLKSADHVFEIEQPDGTFKFTTVRPKRQTIRQEGKRRHAKAGETTQLYHAMRTKQCFKIGEGRCTKTAAIYNEASGKAEKPKGSFNSKREASVLIEEPFRAIRETRNKRSVWTVATVPFKGAHFATFPPDLIEPCVLAGTSDRGGCPTCRSPWVRVSAPTARYAKFLGRSHHDHRDDDGKGQMQQRGQNRQNAMIAEGIVGKETETIGWYPSCRCDGLQQLPPLPPTPRLVAVDPDDPTPEEESAHEVAREGWRVACTAVHEARRRLCEPAAKLRTVPCVVLDHFGGAGTTGLVADRAQRDAVLIEMNPEYAEMARRRIEGDGGLFSRVAAE